MPGVVHRCSGFQDVHADLGKTIVPLEDEAGFDEVDNKDIEEVQASNREEINEVSSKAWEDDGTEIKSFKKEILPEFFSLANPLCEIVGR